MKVYGVGYKRADGEKWFPLGISKFWYKSREAAIAVLKRDQKIARREIENKKCEPIVCGGFGIETEYYPEYTNVEFYLMEAEAPEWKKVGKFTLDDEIK